MKLFGLGKKTFDRGDRAAVLQDTATLTRNGTMTLRQAVAAALEKRGKWTQDREIELYRSIGEAVGIDAQSTAGWEESASAEEKQKAIDKALRYV